MLDYPFQFPEKDNGKEASGTATGSLFTKVSKSSDVTYEKLEKCENGKPIL